MRDQFLRDGYVIVRALFSQDEMRAAADEAQRLLERPELVDRKNLRGRWTVNVDTGDDLFEVFDPITDIAPSVHALATSKKMSDVLTELFGEPAHLFKDKLIYKPAGATGYPLHQDFIAWPHFPESFTTAVIAVDDATPTSGPIEVFPGAHARGALAERDGNFHLLEDDVIAGFAPHVLDLARGDVALFGCFMPHRSAPNASSASRRHLLISYNKASDGGDQRDRHYSDFRHFMRSMYESMGMSDLTFT